MDIRDNFDLTLKLILNETQHLKPHWNMYFIAPIHLISIYWLVDDLQKFCCAENKNDTKTRMVVIVAFMLVIH